ncbi:hypothetical protein DFH06DRAFT_1296387 [Mycena polygramma]|nr:hypothetical protein DFH06DRAFT_1296387 [Mycena polygramma]
MRASTVALLLAASHCAHAASVGSSRRQSVQCAPVDKDGTALTASAGDGDFVSCTYEGAGDCEYFPANGSFSSGSSQCPAGIAQDPSATTDAPSSAGAEPTGTDDGDSDSASATDSDTETETDSDPPLSTPNTSSTTPVISTPAASTPPPVSKTSASGGAGSPASASGSASASPSASGQPGGARALGVPLGALLGAVGLGMMAL